MIHDDQQGDESNCSQVVFLVDKYYDEDNVGVDERGNMI
jgi:hypothetical protein